MIKSNQKYFNWFSRLLDMLLLNLSFRLAVQIWLYDRGDNWNVAYYYAVENPLPALLLFCFFLVVFQYMGLYESFRSRSAYVELKMLFTALSVSTAFALILLFLFKVQEFSRGVMILFFGISYLALSVKRLCVRIVLRAARARGYNRKFSLVIGSGALAAKYIRSIQDNPQFGFHCIGYVGCETAEEPATCLGSYEELEEILQHHRPDEIIVALELDEAAMVNDIIRRCENQGIRTCVIPAFNDYLPGSTSIDSLGDVRLINIRAVPLDIVFNDVLKRIFDILFSLCVLILFSPLYLLLAIGVRLSSPGPILFTQERVGKEQKTFKMYKFRSMRVNDSSDTAWSTKKDSRITPFGAFIRKFSLDEFPQFYNVLIGDMSIVGPRPELPFFVQQYRETIPKYMIKHQVRPGITGWAQVNGYRGDTSIEKRIDYDIWYIENWSPLLDIRIILRTVFGGMMNEERNMEWAEKREAKKAARKAAKTGRSPVAGPQTPAKSEEEALPREPEEERDPEPIST